MQITLSISKLSGRADYNILDQKIIDGTFEKKSNVIKEFERGVKVMNGKYGPYLNFNKKNYKIPKGITPEKITYKECQKIINK